MTVRCSIGCAMLGAILVAACSAQSQSSMPATVPPSTEPATTQQAATTTSSAVPTTTSALSTTSTAATTTVVASTTTTMPWQRFPLSEVEPLVPGEVITVSKIDTDDPVVFITIDDGFYRDPRVPGLLRDAGAVVNLFPVPGYVDEDPDYFREIAALGGSVNSHTMRHRDLRGLSLAAQVDEICSSMDYLRSVFGSAGPFVRPPWGVWDGNTAQAVAQCGGVAIVSWRVTASEGILSTWGDQPIQRGDIILMHFRPTLYDDLLMVFAHLYGLGLTTARLEDYLVVG